MAITSFFYDSVDGDRPYSAKDFAAAFNIILQDGLIYRGENQTLGLDIGGTDYLNIYAGRAVVQGRFVEVTGIETLAVPWGTYTGLVVIRIDTQNERAASIAVINSTIPEQTTSIYEMPIYEVAVTDGVITSRTKDLREQGGPIAKTAENVVTWESSPTGIRMRSGLFGGDGKPIILFLTANRPVASAQEHRVWIQIEQF